VDSGHLVHTNQGTLFAVPFDLASLATVGSAAPVVEGVGGSGEGGGYYDVSRNGVLVFAPGGASGGALMKALWVDRNGRVEPLTEERRDYRNPRFSPDGRRLAVEIETEGNSDVWVLDLERDVPTRLTFHDGYDGNPVWSPDGETLAFSSQRGGGTPNIFRKSADGSGEAEMIAEGEQVLLPWSWSPDGTRLSVIMMNSGTDLDLGLLDVESGKIEPFLATEFIDYGPSFSPDGRWIAYGNNESGNWEAYVRPADGSRGKWQISSGGGTYPTWSRDGKEIFLALEDGRLQVVDVDTSGGGFRVSRPRDLFTGSFADLTTSNNMYDAAPDGEHFVMFQGELDDSSAAHEHVQVITHWFTKLDQTFAK
jgi:Tol biopolymer transport system component